MERGENQVVSHQLTQGVRTHSSYKESGKILKVLGSTKRGMTMRCQELDIHYLENTGKAQLHEEEDSM